MADLNNTTLIAVISAVGFILLIFTAVLCCFLYIFWKRQHAESTTQTDKSHSSSANSGRPLKHRNSNTAGHTGGNHRDTNGGASNRDHDTLNSIDAQQRDSQAPTTTLQLATTNTGSVVHFQQDDMTSSTGTGTGAAEKYDFLVHPEFDYASPISSNSGNGSNSNHRLALYGASRSPAPGLRQTVNLNYPPPQSQPQLAAQQTPQQIALNKLQSQRRRIQAIVKNAKNKLHLVDASHIAFEYEIGRGKFGKVFRALWTDTTTKRQRTVAVKWFKQDEVDEEVFEDFVKEISVAAHLPSHENVLNIYGFCISPYALVTEFVNGGSVEIALSTRHPNSIRRQLCIGDVVQILIDAANGISHLHTMGIIHRDVASRNLLVHNEGLDENNNHVRSRSSHQQQQQQPHQQLPQLPRRRVLVCDFGLSRITTNPDQDNHTNSHVGPLKWMSPESIKLQVYNTKTDVYSFGVSMWEVLCGCPPYPNTKVLSLAVEVISRQIRPLILEWFPRPLSVLMQRCWQEIPEFRPTFEDIKNELMLFKRQLIETQTLDAPLTHLQVLPAAQFKEQLRTLPQLVCDYLDPNGGNIWDTLARNKLQSVIDDYNQRHLPATKIGVGINIYHTQHNQSQNVSRDVTRDEGQTSHLQRNASLLQSMPATPVVRTVGVDVDELVIDVGDDDDDDDEDDDDVGNPHPGSAVVSRRGSLLPQLLNTESMSIQTAHVNPTQTVNVEQQRRQAQQAPQQHQHDVSFSVPKENAFHDKVFDGLEPCSENGDTTTTTTMTLEPQDSVHI